MKNCLFSLLSILFFICSCSTINTSRLGSYNISIKDNYVYIYDTINQRQLDSIIIADTLPGLQKWVKSHITEYENNIKYNYYYYLKKSNNISYTLKEIKDSYFILNKKKLIQY